MSAICRNTSAAAETLGPKLTCTPIAFSEYGTIATTKNKKKAELRGPGADLFIRCIAISEQLDQTTRLGSCVPKRQRRLKVQLFLCLGTYPIHSVSGRSDKKVSAPGGGFKITFLNRA